MRPGCCPWMGAGVGQECSSLQPGCGGCGVGELSPLPLPWSSCTHLTYGTLYILTFAHPVGPGQVLMDLQGGFFGTWAGRCRVPAGLCCCHGAMVSVPCPRPAGSGQSRGRTSNFCLPYMGNCQKPGSNTSFCLVFPEKPGGTWHPRA